jgi:heme exporter protein D
VFNPMVWLGIVLAGISVVLFVVSGAMRRRGVGSARPSRAERRKAAKDGDRAPDSLPAKRSSRKAEPAVQDEDMDDIEAILRRHGIQ